MGHTEMQADLDAIGNHENTSPLVPILATSGASKMNSIRLGLVHANPATFLGAVDRIRQFAASDRSTLIVTPNIAHVWQANRYPALRDAYRKASFAPPDGWPVVKAIQYLSPYAETVERVTGADLLVALCDGRNTVAFVGGAGDAAHLAAKQLFEKNPELEIVSIETAPREELTDSATRRELIDRISRAKPEIVFVGLGVPLQEEFALQLLSSMDRGVIMCVGAAIEFAAGTLSRAPRFFQKTGFEWLYRLINEPRKLAARYMFAAPHFVKVVASERRSVSRLSENG